MNKQFSDFVRTTVLPKAQVNHQWFWKEVAADSWEPETLHVIETLVRPDTHFIDVGAWIGPTTMVGALTALRVTAIEPDPFAYDELQSNVKLLPSNQAAKVKILNVAITPDGKPIKLYFQGNQGGASISSVVSQVGSSVTVKGMRYTDIIDDTQRTVMKIDVEGAEYDLISSTTRSQLERVDAFIISFHPHILLEQLPQNLLLRFVMFHVKYWIVMSRFSGFRTTNLDGTRIRSTNYLSRRLRTVYPDVILAQRIK